MFIQKYGKIRDILLLLILFLVLAATSNAQNIESINVASNSAYTRITKNTAVDVFSLILDHGIESEVVGCGSAADCDNINQCLIYDCIDSTCTFADFKSEGSLFWQENFEDDEPGNLPTSWTAGPGPFFWSVGFTDAVTEPFSLEINGPNDVPADIGSVTLPDITIPGDGGFFSYYLLLSRSPAYVPVIDTVNDVLAVLIDGQLVGLRNTHDPSFVKITIDLPAATYANQSISLSFEWRSGDNSTGKVIIDNLSLQAHAPCNDNNFCTDDDFCTFGSCGGNNIPGCDDSDGDVFSDGFEDGE